MFLYVTNSEQRVDMFRTQYWVVDINTLTPVWLLCLMSKTIRQEVMNIFYCNSTESQLEPTTASTEKVKRKSNIVRPTTLTLTSPITVIL